MVSKCNCESQTAPSNHARSEDEKYGQENGRRNSHNRPEPVLRSVNGCDFTTGLSDARKLRVTFHPLAVGGDVGSARIFNFLL